MPLRRYQIRNEYGLADPDLYKAADKDDPEALLEGVAMAGLVGVLRQLGDLAEFAAEIFHDLHEEVMATAARGHGLMARVQQLEAEFPSVEKAFLSQTNLSSFFSTTGVKWHPNLRMEQNLVTRGDLPRFVMDSYEESRAPPRLFLLDKFDVAGAGACLKRYTDPSFFKGETASSGMPTVDIQREKKIRKVKKKGSRWRNGETPEVMPTSHAKLHQLFLEERVENAHPDPARLVKLKRRQLNGSALDPKTGKSYMEKFLGSPSPEHKAVCEVSVAPLALKLTSDNYSESGPDIHEVSMVSPVKQSLNGKQRFCSSPNVQEEVVRKPYMDELNVEEAVDRQLVRVTDFMAESEMDDSPSSVQKMEIKEEVSVGVEDKTKGSTDGEHSDDVTSEVDNYMDALTTMDSEMDTDNEYKTKTEQSILNVRKDGTDSDANEEQLDIQANLSDSQSIGNSSISDVRNSLSKKGRFSFSSSDSHSSSVEHTPSDGGAACSSRSNRSSVSENMDFASDNLSTAVETKGFESNEVAEAAVIDDTYVEEDKIAHREESSSSLPDSNMMLLPSLSVGNSMTVSLKGHDSDENPPDHTESSGSVEGDNNVIDLANSSAVNPDVSSLERHDILPTVSSESFLQDKLDNEGPDVSSDAFVQTSNMLEQGPEKRGNSSPLNNLLQTDYSGESCAENLGEEKMEAPLSVISSSVEQLSSSASLEVEVESGVILSPDFSDTVKPDVLVSEVDEAIAAEAVNSDGLLSVLDAVGTDSIKEHQSANIATVTSQADLDSVWMGVPYSKEKMKVENISGIGDVDEMDDEFTGKVDDAVGGDAIPVEHPSKSAEPGLEDEVNLDNVTAKKGQGEDDYIPTAVANESTCVSTDLICSPSRSSSGLQKSPVLEVPQQQDLDLDAANCPEHSLGLSQREGKQAASAEGLGSAEDKLEIKETVHYQSLVEEIQTSYTADVSLELSPEVNKNKLESEPAFQNQSEKKSEDGVCSPPCNFTEAKTSLEQSMQSQADQLSAEFVHVDIHESMSTLDDLLAKTSVEQSMQSQADQLSAEFVHVDIRESTSKLDDLLDSEPEVALENSARLQSDPLEGAYLQAVGGSPESSSDLHSKQIKTDEQRLLAGSLKSCLEELPSQELLLQASCQDLHVTRPAVNPFDSVFPKFGASAEATHINMEETQEIPPLPPLPPMQWRIGKVQPAPQTELVHHSREMFPPMQPFTNPFLCLNVPDGPEPLHLAADQVGNASHPNPFSSEIQSTADDENSRQDCLPLEDKPDLSNSTEILNERLAVQSSSPLPAMEYKTSGDSHGSLEGPQMQLVDQLVHHKDLDAKTPEDTSLNAEREEGHSADKPVLSSVVEQQPQQNSVTYLGETTWPSTSFVLPPTYEIGKSNGNKLPRPRNPLIDAVAAIDKSKLRKVSERARPLVEPKVDERDSLLQQIRTKSFNLKPAAATRPSIQPVQDQKTNLQVAAIIAKANAIRQALAGSDEDDSDSWSDC